MSGLSEAEREVLLIPCACGHAIDFHGSLAGCWTCGDEGDDCGETLEALLAVRLERITTARVSVVLAVVQADYDLQCPPRRSTFAESEFGRGAYCAHLWWSTVLGATLRRHAIPTDPASRADRSIDPP